jgi:ADP-ribose pyrophosphatase
MPGQKEEHKHWKRSHSDADVEILKRGRHLGACFKNHDRLVIIIPAFPDGTLVMGETYRAIMDDISLEFPSATRGEGETSKEVAERLSRIHNQAEVSETIHIGEIYTSPGYLDQMVDLYLVKVNKPKGGKMTPPAGMLSLRALSVQEISETIAKGGMLDATTSACLMRYLTLNRQGEGLLPTRMRHIEILDANAEPITTILTNRPEWSFIEFQDEHPDLARDWRFRDVEDIVSPTGEPIPVKSSLAMRLRRGASAPEPAFQDASAPSQSNEPAPAADEPATAGIFSSARKHKTEDRRDEAVSAAALRPEADAPRRSPLFSRPMSQSTADEPHTSADPRREAEPSPAEAQAPSRSVSPQPPSERPSETPRRRLTLSVPQAPTEDVSDHPTASTAPVEQSKVERPKAEAASTPEVDAPRAVPSIALRSPSRLKGAWGRQEPQVASKPDALKPISAQEKPKAPVAPKRKPSAMETPKEEGGLSRLTGFFKKAMQKEEPKAPERAAVPPHVLYGVDDAFDELTPPGPVFKPPAGWGEDKS